MLDTKIRVTGITNIKYKDKEGKVVPGQSVRFVAEEPILPTSTIIINQSKVEFEANKKYTLSIAEV